ncbi:MAG: PilT/PilU family type 4a pilus ATPase [Verrucomicrobia bacterium]|nr:PilT/PilU family type 4a pilus ATPase [Verrucomicrobiota bacterium]
MDAPPESIELYCRAAHEYKASDLILHVGEPPIVRVSGSITPMEAPPLSLHDLMAFRAYCGVPSEATDHDASFISGEGIRFRVNFHRQLGAEAAVLRMITGTPPDIDTLGVPSEILKKMVARSSGIIIVSGPTGSGKSTTLAALLEWVNKNMERHVVTIEDPIEFIFQRDRSLFTQRSVGLDTPSFAEGLRRSLRQAPDIILVGEIRDATTAAVALQAAETGHLVLTTLHASDVGEVLDRIMAFFPEREKKGHLQVLAGQLLGILCQKLLPTTAGGMVLATEFLTNLGLSRQCIRDADLPALRDFISHSDPSESYDFLSSFLDLVTTGKIAEDTALLAVPNPAELKRRLRGITSSSS